MTNTTAPSRASNLLSGIRRVTQCAAIVGLAFFFAGCDLRPNRIGVSNTTIDFGLNETPFPLYVWNTFSRIPLMRIHAEASAEWIQLTPTTVDSLWSSEAGFDKRSIIVRINRTLLSEGAHTGQITLTATAMRPRIVEVRVFMDADGRLSGLNIMNPVAFYSKPYLLDFVFSLRDNENKAIVADPSQFTLAAFEDNDPVRAAETGLALRRAPPRQLFLDFVLDYSLSMQETLGAIQSMEDAARNDVLRFLNPDAAAGITVFSRDDRAPVVVADFTTDHAHLREQLSRIQRDHVGRFASGAPLFDALQTSLDKFEEGYWFQGYLPDRFDPWLPIFMRADEDAVLYQSRHIYVITDGYDTSSEATLNDVIRRARNLFVRINVIGIGDEPHLANLLALAGETRGRYFAYRDDREGISPHLQETIGNLDGQYRLRWATLNRRNQGFAPRFQIGLASKQALYADAARYNPRTYADDTLRGVVRGTHYDDGLRSSVQITADYIPRFVYDLRFYLEATHPFVVQPWGAESGGLLEGWELETTVIDDRRVWLHYYSLTAPLPFAGYGALFGLDFGESLSVERPTLTRCEIDNSLYEDAVYFDVALE